MSSLKSSISKSAFSVEKPEDSLGFLLWQIMITWQRSIKKSLDSYDISHPQFVILASLRWFEENQLKPTQIKIANLTKLDKMTVSKAVRKLADMSLLTRYENENDPRAKTVLLTEKGHKVIEILAPMVERIDESFFNGLDNSKQDQLKNLMQELNAN